MKIHPFKVFFFCLIGLQLLILIAMGASKLYPRELQVDAYDSIFLGDKPKNTASTTPTQSIPKITYRFTNPRIAYEVLKKLDVFKPVDKAYFISPYTEHYDEPSFGLKNDDEYCDKHRAYIVAYPEAIFRELNFIADYRMNSFLRSKVLPKFGTDIMPYVGLDMPKSVQASRTYDVKPYANVFHTHEKLNSYKHIGKHFSCLSQASNHVPGHTILSKKNLVAEAANKYIRQFADRPQCIREGKIFPKTWLLYDKEDCDDFFKAFNSAEYQAQKKEKRIVYIRKVGAGSHGGEGVQPVNDEEEVYLRKLYDNGKKCGNVTKNFLMQNYVHNPLLLNGHKFDFRMYMLVASSNPLIAYYHDGGLRVTLQEYDINSDDKKSLLTNIGLNKQTYMEAKDGKLFNGLDEEGIKVAQEWTFDRLQAYLLEEGIISDPNWLDNYLRPEFKKAFIHLIRVGTPYFLKTSSVYGLFGTDFMLDADLNLWFVEANAGPAYPEFSQPIQRLVTEVFRDQFEIVMGLLRSRMKRVIKYVNELIEEGAVEEIYRGEIKIDKLEERRKVFEEITKNYFEPEFEPSPNNTFSKIIDENYEGVERYQGLIPLECY